MSQKKFELFKMFEKYGYIFNQESDLEIYFVKVESCVDVFGLIFNKVDNTITFANDGDSFTKDKFSVEFLKDCVQFIKLYPKTEDKKG
jgi:hypothetical protein